MDIKQQVADFLGTILVQGRALTPEEERVVKTGQSFLGALNGSVDTQPNLTLERSTQLFKEINEELVNGGGQ